MEPGVDDERGHIETNRRLWDERVPINEASTFYDLAGFRSGMDVLDPFQRVELREAAGDLTGQRLLHLQCHLGLDTLAWARQGARVTGLDFSAPATRSARRLAADLGLAERAEFVTSDVYAAVEAVNRRRFDVVYTGGGALCWLPDLTRWARTVADLLRPGGVLYLVEFHPFSDILDDERGREVVVDYFHSAAQVYDSPGSYADRQAETSHNTAVEWQHPLGTVVTAVAEAGLRVEFLHEHDSTLFARYGSLVRTAGRYHYPADEPRCPLRYSLIARA